VGSDSNTCIDPFAELRQLEWSQRLAAQARNVLAAATCRWAGALHAAAAGGAKALRRPRVPLPRDVAPISWCSIPTTGARRAAGADGARCRGVRPVPHPVRDVMVGGRWVVRDGITEGGRVLANYRDLSCGACRHESGVRPADHGAHLATMAARRPMARFATAPSASWARPSPGSAPSATCRATRRRIASLHAHGAWALRAHRLPHASRLRRQSRGRVRSAAQRRHVREIARAGGGIKATVRATRAASEDELVAASRPRLAALAAEGVTTVEIKSGYGLDTANECRQLRAARRVAAEVGVDVRTTLLAAHAVPVGVRRARRRLHRPRVSRNHSRGGGLADAVDAFCETIGFSEAQTRRVCRGRAAHGLPVKLHADQLSDAGGAALAAEFGALSADHLEYTSDAGVAAMARAGRSRCCCPAPFMLARDAASARSPRSARRRAHGVATDCNPGTSPSTSLPLMLNMACTLFHLTPEEALAGSPTCGARARA
jgi:imidazolonepropionase